MTIAHVGSMKLEVTDWFPGTARPAREGVYERRAADGGYSCWDGATWAGGADSPAAAAGSRQPSREQQAPWRGLAEASDLPCATCKGHGVVDAGYDDEAARDLIDECVDC